MHLTRIKFDFLDLSLPCISGNTSEPPLECPPSKRTRETLLALQMRKVWTPREGGVQEDVVVYHNPGGRSGNRPELSQEQIDFLLSLPAAKVSRRRKQRSGCISSAGRPHISGQTIGSSSVRILDKITIYEPHMRVTYSNMYLGCPRRYGNGRRT